MTPGNASNGFGFHRSGSSSSAFSRPCSVPSLRSVPFRSDLLTSFEVRDRRTSPYFANRRIICLVVVSLLKIITCSPRHKHTPTRVHHKTHQAEPITNIANRCTFAFVVIFTLFALRLRMFNVFNQVEYCLIYLYLVFSAPNVVHTIS